MFSSGLVARMVDELGLELSARGLTPHRDMVAFLVERSLRQRSEQVDIAPEDLTEEHLLPLWASELADVIEREYDLIRPRLLP